VSENPADFREALSELIELAGPEPADHPSGERWIAYQRGELPAEEEARLAEHLVHCRDCFDLVQAADALFGEKSADEESEKLASAAVWRLLGPELSGKTKAPVVRARRPGWRFRLPYALAAALVALLGMTAWNLEQRSALQALRAPRANVPIYDFSGGERLSEPVEKTARPGPSVLVFHPTEERKVYRLAVRDAGTRRELSSHDLRPNADFALTFDLPEGLPPGRYQLELAEDSGRVLETYLLRVDATAPGG